MRAARSGCERPEVCPRGGKIAQQSPIGPAPALGARCGFVRYCGVWCTLVGRGLAFDSRRLHHSTRRNSSSFRPTHRPSPGSLQIFRGSTAPGGGIAVVPRSAADSGNHRAFLDPRDHLPSLAADQPALPPAIRECAPISGFPTGPRPEAGAPPGSTRSVDAGCRPSAAGSGSIP